MAITLNIEPSMPDPIPVNRPIYWELEADNADVFTSTGTKPVIQIVWPASPTAPADGSEFTLWGYLFTVDSGTAFTGNSFRVVTGDMATTRNNFRSMLQANFFFSKAVTFQVTGTGGNTLNVLWRDCREQENFGTAGMEYATLEAAGATVTVTNGASPVTVDGHKIVTSLVRYDPSTNTYTEITPQEGVDTVADCLFSYAVGIDFQRQISDLLYTNIPALTTDSFDIPGYDTMFQYFALKYGWIYREDCRALSGDFQYTDLVRVWNAVILDTDITGIRKYYPGAVGGLPDGQDYVKFLTDAPVNGLHLRTDSFSWAWFFVNKNEYTYDTLKVIVNFLLTTGVGGTYDEAITDILADDDGVACVNTSPGFVIDNTVATDANLESYTIKIYAYDGGDFVQITETLQFYIDRECGSNADMYFRNRLGGIDTLPVIVTEEVAAQSGEEIRLSLKPVTTTVERMTLRGRTLSNVVNQKRFTIHAKQDWSDDYVYFFESFRTSTMRYLQVFGKDGTPYAQKVVIDPGNVTIRKEGEKIILEASGYYAHDIFAQSTTEPQMF